MDLTSGGIFTLKDLFNENSNYKVVIEDEIKKIEQNEIKAEWEPSLKFRIKMRWIFWKAKMKERFFK